MDFTLNHEQRLLRDGLTKFLATRYDLEKSRSAAKTGPGWQPDVWHAFADELGLLGAALPEEVGGRRRPADDEGRAWPSLDRARDEGQAAVCAEAVGGMRKVLADTVEYCKQRHQFGQPIALFQVLQHRMVDMHIELEQSVAAVYLAVLNLEGDAATRARAVSAASATIGRAARFIGQNAVQLHGGMGMTEELAVGHYFKRLTAVQYEFGSTDYHVARYAELTTA